MDKVILLCLGTLRLRQGAGNKVDSLAQTDLRQMIEIGLDHTGNARVTAGSLRVGHQHDWLAVMRHLHHARQQPVRQHFAVGGATQRIAAVQTISHAIALRAELPGGAPKSLLRLGAELGIFRSRQGADAIIEQQLLYATAVLRQGTRLAQRQAVAVFQVAPFQPAKGSFDIRAARTEHFGHGDAPESAR